MFSDDVDVLTVKIHDKYMNCLVDYKKIQPAFKFSSMHEYHIDKFINTKIT